MKRILLFSSSRVFGNEPLEYCKDDIFDYFNGCNVEKVLFIPYASFHHDEYASKVKMIFEKIGLQMDSIHEYENPVDAINQAQGIYIGGGNTFLLLKTLYDNNIIEAIRKRVLQESIPYMGSSAGSNVATISINTTNDMPIVYPPSFSAINLVPFNINPHFIEPDTNSKHMGETRALRIEEYHESSSVPVLGLREGSWLDICGDRITLKGNTGAKLFKRYSDPIEYSCDADLSFLMVQ
ncbi:Alpha-aspartyl dipeptidase [Nymphon striatum]|nr:Alpha-aspartyl dipeptidase [Nymphon striatum]